MTILHTLTPANVAELFDARTFIAGFDYATSGRVGDREILKLTADTVIGSAPVRGSGQHVYVVQVYAEFAGNDLWITSTCTCPVRIDCKHGVALACVLGQGAVEPAPSPAPAWQRQLGDVVRELADREADAVRERTALAVEVAVGDRRYGYLRSDDLHPLEMRVLRRSARGDRWVKSGAEWTSLAQPVARAGFRPHELDPLLELLAALQLHDPSWRYGLTSPRLAAFGPRLVPLLQRVVGAGVPLVPGAGLTSVELSGGAAEPVGDLRRVDGRIRLALGVELDGTRSSGSEIVPIGSPAHAVGLLHDGALRIAATSRPIPSALQRVLVAGGEVSVPEQEAPELDDHLRPLSRAVSLASGDASVTVPEQIRPTLRLTVLWRSATDAGLQWTWRYDEHACDLDSTDLLAGLRDRHAERTIRDRVPPELLRLAHATGGDALALAVHDLPGLREVEDVEVVEESRPDFRESTADPTISFELPEPTDAATDWLDLAVTIDVEGESVPLTHVLAALTLGEEFIVLPSGLYLRADRPELDRLREIVAEAAQLREADGDRISVGKHDLGVWGQLAELGIVDAQAAEWVHRAAALSNLDELPRPEPTGLVTELRSYQREGFWWLAFLWQHRLGGILADDMGLGKTLQVLALIQHAVTTEAPGPFLVVAPTSVVSAWRSEAARHAPGLRVATVTRRSDDIAATTAEADVVITTYSLLRLERDAFAAVAWAGLVLDEAQQVKNHRSQTYGAARLLDAPFRLAVTGTPFENRLMELWSLLSITVPGIYPWPRSFTSQVVTPVEKNGDQAALDRFLRRIRPFLLRRTKELVAADLPPKQEQVLEIELNPRHRKLYDAHLARERQRILGLLEDFEQNRVAIFSALTTLRRAALDAALLDPAHDRVGSAKLDVLVDHLAEITAEGHRALVFSQFTSYLTRVETGLAEAGIETTYLDGSTTDRDAAIGRFRGGSAPVFLISLKAGGVGLTLTEADYVFVLDPWWNPAVEAQAVDRAHRIGQTRPVHVYRLIATDTIEEKVMALKERKAELFARVIDGDAGTATGLTAADVRALFDE